MYSVQFISRHPKLKFVLFEKHAKFENTFLSFLTNQLIYLVNVKNHEEDFFKLFSKSPNFK